MPNMNLLVGNRHPTRIIVGYCPGRQEEADGRPFAGSAGTYLDTVLLNLSQRFAPYFPSGTRDDYTLLNAHPQPRYRVPGVRRPTIPTRDEVLDAENLQALHDRFQEALENNDPDSILLLGSLVEWLAEWTRNIYPNVLLFGCGHPSIQAWNTKYCSGLPQSEKLRRWVADTFRMIE